MKNFLTSLFRTTIAEVERGQKIIGKKLKAELKNLTDNET